MREQRAAGNQIDRLKLDELERNGEYRVIPSPVRRQNPGNWVFDSVPRIEAGAIARSGTSLEGVA